jgi:hypothetical protein
LYQNAKSKLEDDVQAKAVNNILLRESVANLNWMTT